MKWWYVVGECGLVYASMMAFRLRSEGPAQLPPIMGPFKLAEAISTFGWIILGLAGFFLTRWYVPILCVFGASGLQRVTPDSIWLRHGGSAQLPDWRRRSGVDVALRDNLAACCCYASLVSYDGPKHVII